MRNKFFDYPLRPANALFGLGLPTSLKILGDYAMEKCRGLRGQRPPVSLEDWVVSNFGRTMFEIYFKVYSEKVWGIPCNTISAEWVDRRINGLSLAKAIRNAFAKANGRKIPTLVDEFLYPELGIGRISDRLKEGIELSNPVMLETSVEAIHHAGNTIEKIVGRRTSLRERNSFRVFLSIILSGCLNLQHHRISLRRHRD
jgi:protoporphyrinogen oxidase